MGQSGTHYNMKQHLNQDKDKEEEVKQTNLNLNYSKTHVIWYNRDR